MTVPSPPANVPRRRQGLFSSLSDSSSSETSASTLRAACPQKQPASSPPRSRLSHPSVPRISSTSLPVSSTAASPPPAGTSKPSSARSRASPGASSSLASSTNFPPVTRCCSAGHVHASGLGLDPQRRMHRSGCLLLSGDGQQQHHGAQGRNAAADPEHRPVPACPSGLPNPGSADDPRSAPPCPSRGARRRPVCGVRRGWTGVAPVRGRRTDRWPRTAYWWPHVRPTRSRAGWR